MSFTIELKESIEGAEQGGSNSGRLQRNPQTASH